MIAPTYRGNARTRKVEERVVPFCHLFPSPSLPKKGEWFVVPNTVFSFWENSVLKPHILLFGIVK